jgi:hypothetical protein
MTKLTCTPIINKDFNSADDNPEYTNNYRISIYKRVGYESLDYVNTFFFSFSK